MSGITRLGMGVALTLVVAFAIASTSQCGGQLEVRRWRSSDVFGER